MRFRERRWKLVLSSRFPAPRPYAQYGTKRGNARHRYHIRFLAVYFILQFGPTANLEIKYEEGKATSPGLAERSKEIVKPFVGVFVVLTTFLGLLKSTESYLTTVVLKEELQSYQAIRDVMTDYYIIAAALTIVVSLSVGWLTSEACLTHYLDDVLSCRDAHLSLRCSCHRRAGGFPGSLDGPPCL